ncbi:MAG: hypothetical protein HQK49_05330 [Oligoflexia bacterium]|nr:hypothetical protein [Oligoflexia bacterium]
MKLKCGVVFILFSLSSFLQAAEIDSFTQRYDKINDSTEALNNLVNKHLIKAIEETNSCDRDLLFKKVYNELGYGLLWSRIENLISDEPTIDKRFTYVNKSVYRGISFYQSPAIHIGKLNPIIKIGEYIVGSDKFAHFFAFGYDSYKMAFIDKKGVIEAIKYTESTERGIYGYYTTGIYSYGDLVANYQGMLFWREFVYDGSGLTIENSKTLIKCQNNKWFLFKRYDVRDYIDFGWDEGINCNKYSNKNFSETVLSNISKLELEPENKDYSYMCPIDPWGCEFLLKKYADLSGYLISPTCLQEVIR